MPNGSHTHIVGRFIPAILLEYDDFSTFLPAIRTSCKAYCPPTGSHNVMLDGLFSLSASPRSILVCLFTPNGSHTHIVGRFIPAILLEYDDFCTFLPAIRTSCNASCPPLEAIIQYWMVHSRSLPAVGAYWCVYSCQNGSHTHIVGRFIPAILLEYDDFSTFLPAIRTSCEAYCPPLEAIMRCWMVYSRSLPALGAYWCVSSRQMAAILT